MHVFGGEKTHFYCGGGLNGLIPRSPENEINMSQKPSVRTAITVSSAKRERGAACSHTSGVNELGRKPVVATRQCPVHQREWEESRTRGIARGRILSLHLGRSRTTVSPKSLLTLALGSVKVSLGTLTPPPIRSMLVGDFP